MIQYSRLGITYDYDKHVKKSLKKVKQRDWVNVFLVILLIVVVIFYTLGS